MKVMTVAEYAKQMKVSKSAVYDAVSRGEIDHIRVGAAIRIPVPDELADTAKPTVPERQDVVVEEFIEDAYQDGWNDAVAQMGRMTSQLLKAMKDQPSDDSTITITKARR